jgi:hypothetical protein
MWEGEKRNPHAKLKFESTRFSERLYHQRNCKETARNPEELHGIQRNCKESRGIARKLHGIERKLQGIQRNCKEIPMRIMKVTGLARNQTLIAT